MKWIKHILRIFLDCLAALVAVVLLVAVLTPLWWPRLVKLVEHRLSEQLSAGVSLEGLRMVWPLAIRCDAIRVADEHELHVKARDLDARISLRRLLRGMLWVYRAEVQALEIRGWPERPNDVRPTEPFDLAVLLAYTDRVVCERFDAHQVQLAPPLLPVPMALEVHSSLIPSAASSRPGHVVWHVRLRSDLGDADLRADWASGDDMIKARMHGEILDIARWATLTGIDMDGRLAGRVEVDIPVSLKGFRGSAVLGVEAFRIGDVQVAQARWQAHGDASSMAWDFMGEGDFMDAWSLRLRGRLQGRDALVFEAVDFDHTLWPAKTVTPLTVVRAEDVYLVEHAVVRVGEGVLDLSGRWSVEEVRLDAGIREVPLTGFGFEGVHPAQGRMEGRLRISGAPANPRMALELDFRDILPKDTGRWAGPPAQFDIRAEVQDRRFQMHWRLAELTGQPVEFDLSFPLRVSLHPLEWEWPPEGEIRGRFTADTGLDELTSLFVVDAHRLAGQLSVGLTLGGTWADPDVTGFLHIHDGYYEHERWGTLLRDIEMRLSGQRDHLAIDKFSATDAGRGSLALQGQLRFQPEDGFPFEVKCELSELCLVRNDTLQAFGHGHMRWEGNRHHSGVSGQLRVQPVEFRIPERWPPALIDLEVIEADSLDESQMELDDRDGSRKRPPHRLALDVGLSVPDRFFVRGRGLDSEWGGQMSFQGTADHPVISGSLSILRGRFIFFGKRMAITHGLLAFDGSHPPVPQLDVTAESRSGGITAILRLTGPVDSPDIELDSRPAMPEDEILARLLFGRAAARITPWQALAMAQAVNRLRGGHAFDVIGATRRRLGVDQIELRAGDEEEVGMVLQVGKYVSDRVYVEIERGVSAEGARAMVEVELSPTFRLETEAGINAESGLGLLWSWDY